MINIKVVSLFSGCGGLDLGFINKGFNIIYAADIDNAVVETYKENLGNYIQQVDITKIDKETIPDCDIIIGGSPCQGFSNANRHNNFLDNPKNLLVKEFIKTIKIKQPSFFVLENVPQILTAGNGKFKNEIISELDEYYINSKILNAADFGVPQIRKRAFIVGSKTNTFNFPESNTKIYKTVSEAFDGLNYNINNQLDYSKSKKTTIEKMEYIKQGGNWQNLPDKLKPSKKTHSSVYKRLDFNKPSITITNPRKAVLIHPIENRILSIRECARLQSFPDWFIFKGSLANKQQIIADVIPILLAEKIAEKLLIMIEL